MADNEEDELNQHKKARITPLLWNEGSAPIDDAVDEKGKSHIHLACVVQGERNNVCRKYGCNFAQAVGNYGYCPFHASHFLPKADAPGGLLLGKEFMRKKSSNRLCACGKDKCRLIGYATAGSYRIPKNLKVASEWFAALSIRDKKRQKELLSGDHRIAYWHWIPEHRTCKRNGMWKVNALPPSGRYQDNDTKIWDCLPPIYPLQSFVIDCTNARHNPRVRVPRPQLALSPVLTANEQPVRKPVLCLSTRGSASSVAAARVQTTKRNAPIICASPTMYKQAIKELTRAQREVQVTKLAYAQSVLEQQKLSAARLAAQTREKETKLSFAKEMNAVRVAHDAQRKKDLQNWSRSQQQAANTVLSQHHDAAHAAIQAMGLEKDKEIAELKVQHQMQLQQVKAQLMHIATTDANHGAARHEDELTRTTHYYKSMLQQQQALSEQEAANLRHQRDVVVVQNDALQQKLTTAEEELNAALQQAREGPAPLRYSHFIGEGRMKKHGAAFFPLPFNKKDPDMECVELFLNTINIKKEGDANDLGVCSRLRRYSRVTALQRAGVKVAEDPEVPDARRVRGLASEPGSVGAPRKLHWKDEFLIYCCFHYADMTYRQIEALMDVSSGVCTNAVRAFGDYLDIFFARAFPNPTHDELRRNYPTSFIETFLHASITMILDCTDQAMQDPRSKLSHSLFWSQYHKMTAAKYVVGCTPFGMVPHSWCPDGFPSSITDPNAVIASKIIEKNLSRGDVVEVDKGFLIENICILLGIRVMRPTTFFNKQRQASKGDTEKTKDIGNTRIIIEQVNRQGKSEFRLWNRKFPLLMKDCMSQLMRNGFMFANFKPAFVIGRDTF